MPQNLFSALFILTGIILLALGVIRFLHQRSRIARAIKTEGTVVELLQQRVEGKYIRTKTPNGIKLENKYRYRPVIEFKSQSGRAVRFSTSIAQSPAPFQVGDKVAVIYEPENPKQAQIYDLTHVWFPTLMLIGFGFFFAGMGLFGLALQ